jgi:hypothetical protein
MNLGMFGTAGYFADQRPMALISSARACPVLLSRRPSATSAPALRQAKVAVFGRSGAGHGGRPVQKVAP